MNPENDSIVFNEQDPPKLNSTLNVLTILTFIGCGVFALFTIATPWLLGFFSKMMTKAAESPDLSPEKMADLRKAKESMELVQHNMIPLLVLGIAGIVMCFIGASMMRKLKKDGYWIYVAGQIVPIAGSIIIVGTSQYQGVSSFFVPAVQAVFIVLYTMQKKNLIH